MNSGVHPFWLYALVGGVAALPLFLGTATSYVKFSIVFSLFRGGFGSQQVPGVLTASALSFTLTLLVLGPQIDQTIDAAKKLRPIEWEKPPSRNFIDEMKPLVAPWYDFLMKHSGVREREAASA